MEHAVPKNANKPDLIAQNTGMLLGNDSLSSTNGLTSTLARHAATKAAEEAAVLQEQHNVGEERALLEKQPG